MSSTAVWILIAAIALILILAVIIRSRRRRRMMLQDRFGTEYDHAVEETGRRSRAERELQGRIEERDRLDIRSLDTQERTEFSRQWTDTQTLFVDDPPAALSQADRVVQNVMRRRGYPVGDFAESAAVLSVDHSRVMEQYRTAHEISIGARRNSVGTEAPVTTEEMRRGMNHYRGLFEVLLSPDSHDVAGHSDVAGTPEASHRATAPDSPESFNSPPSERRT
jgi:hypothetical protein